MNFNKNYCLLSIFNIALVFAVDACSNEDKTYAVTLRPHIQKEVQDAIVALSDNAGNTDLVNSIVGTNGESAAALASLSYLGTLIDDINKDLKGYKVQIDLDPTVQETDEITGAGQFDPSCEIMDPVPSRLDHALQSLENQMKGSIGNHLYLFGCVYTDPKHTPVAIKAKGKCARVVGLLWDGSIRTQNNLKSAIIEAVSGTRNAYADGSLKGFDRGALCRYVQKCIGETQTALGQLLPHLAELKMTKDSSGQDVLDTLK